MNQFELNHLVQKCYSIDKQLGGNADTLKKTKKSKEFDVIKDILIQKIFQIRKLQDQRDEKLNKYGNDRDLIQLNSQIRDEIKEAEKMIKQMGASLERMRNKKKTSQEELDLRAKLLGNYTQNVENLKARELGEINNNDDEDEKPVLLKDMQQQLYGNKNREVVYQMTKDEEEAMKRFEQQDQIIDDKLVIVMDGLDQLKNGAQQIGQKIDQTKGQIDGLHREVDKTNQTLLGSNKKLKELLIKFRQPNKFCLDITLFLLFLGIIGVIVNMFYSRS